MASWVLITTHTGEGKGAKPQEVRSQQALGVWWHPKVVNPCVWHQGRAEALILSITRPGRPTSDTSDRINQKSKVKHIPDLKSQIVHLQGKLVRVWPLAFLSPTHTKAASWNPQYLAAKVILTQTRSTQVWLELRRNVGSCRDWAYTHTQSLCTCRHRCDPFWGERIVSERSGTAVGAEVMPSALCPLWTNPSTS